MTYFIPILIAVFVAYVGYIVGGLGLTLLFTLVCSPGYLLNEYGAAKKSAAIGRAGFFLALLGASYLQIAWVVFLQATLVHCVNFLVSSAFTFPYWVAAVFVALSPSVSMMNKSSQLISRGENHKFWRATMSFTVLLGALAFFLILIWPSIIYYGWQWIPWVGELVAR